jgi:Cu+-exporting ATPase
VRALLAVRVFARREPYCPAAIRLCPVRLAPQVLPGWRVPADGEVLEGQSYINEAMVTGGAAAGAGFGFGVGVRERLMPGRRLMSRCCPAKPDPPCTPPAPGESEPVLRGPGEPLIGGTLNTGSALLMRATRVGSDTVLAQIVRLVRRAQMSKAPIQVRAPGWRRGRGVRVWGEAVQTGC